MTQTQTAIFRQTVAAHMALAPALAQASTALGDAVSAMREAAATSICICDAAGGLSGIITEQDVARRIAFSADQNSPAGDFMSAPAIHISQDELVFRAIAVMRQHGLRHLPVVDGAGRPVGMMQLDTALLAATPALIEQIDNLTHADSLAGMIRTKAAQAELAKALLVDRVPVPEIQSLLSFLNRYLYRRVTELSLRKMEAEGLGELPVKFAIIVMGSGGRDESYIQPDQDNGMIIDNYPDHDHDRIDGWFYDLAQRINQALDQVGMPLCNGHVMAKNPLWRKSRQAWQAQMDYWIAKGNPSALQLADIFFDFQTVYGPPAFAQQLWAHIFAKLDSNRHFLREMYRNDEAYGVALNLFNRFIVATEPGRNKGAINLKLNGTLPLVEAVRIFSLQNKIPETSTMARIDALVQATVLDRDEADYLQGAFLHITRLLLHQQLLDFDERGEVDNYVHPRSLTRRQKDILVDSLKAIERLHERLRSELTGELF